MSARLSEAKDTTSRFHFSMTSAHTLVAQACLGLLLHLDETVTEDSLKNFPLSEYAAKYWVGHARNEYVSSKVQDGMKRLCDPGRSHLSVWVWIYDLEYNTHPWDRPKRSERPGKARATSLHYAALCGMYDVAKFLIVERSQDVNARGFHSKETVLHVASRCGHADIAQLLLEHDADGNAQDDDGHTPLNRSSKFGHVEVVRILLEHGADTEICEHANRSPLVLASREGHVGIARLLLSHGADANASTSNGWTPLSFASYNAHVVVARVLLEHGADANAENADYETPLHLAACASNRLEKRLDVVRLLVQYGSDIHAQDGEGRTPFMVATEKGRHKIMEILLECGAEDHRKLLELLPPPWMQFSHS